MIFRRNYSQISYTFIISDIYQVYRECLICIDKKKKSFYYLKHLFIAYL